MNGLAAERGGRCLSPQYCGDAAKLTWACALGHSWKAAPTKIKQGRWCPECSSGLGERLVRFHLEAIFGVPFPKVRPSWLLSPTGRPMELDGYNEALGLAFEHDGPQHREPVKFFGGPERAALQRSHDELKDRICEVRGVVLVRVDERVQSRVLRQVLLAALDLRSVFVPFREQPVAWQDVYRGAAAEQMLAELRQIANNHDGQLVSEAYSGSRVPLFWRCIRGHCWFATPASVKNSGSWCRGCAGYEKKSLAEVAAAGRRVGLILLSTKYESAHKKLHWICERGHDVRKDFSSVRDGHGCYVCRGGGGPKNIS
jgi:hypothetical protein